jgi:hypothetical protein
LTKAVHVDHDVGSERRRAGQSAVFDRCAHDNAEASATERCLMSSKDNRRRRDPEDARKALQPSSPTSPSTTAVTVRGYMVNAEIDVRVNYPSRAIDVEHLKRRAPIAWGWKGARNNERNRTTCRYEPAPE